MSILKFKDVTPILPKLPPSPYTYNTLFGLVYTTGIRVGEALGINLDDVYLNRQRLYIREGKFYKARWIPITLSTYNMLRSYINKRVVVLTSASDVPLFIRLRKIHLALLVALTIEQTYCMFCQLSEHIQFLFEFQK